MEPRPIREQYEALGPALVGCKREARGVLRDLLRGVLNAHLVRARLQESRIKRLSSIQRKAQKNGWAERDAIRNTPDLVGFRIVCNNLEDLKRIRDLILESSRFRSVGDQAIQDFVNSPQDSGYRALHLNVVFEVTGPKPTPVACEIQIQTLAQDMWARLAHYDIYKHGETVPPHILKSSERLASLLAVADEIAQDIREQVSQPLAGVQEPGDQVKPEALAFVYRRAFGSDPPDYLVRVVLDVCEEVGCYRLDAIDRVLRDDAMRSRVAEAYEEASSWSLSEEAWYELSPIAAIHGLEKTVQRAAELGRMERQDIEAIAMRELKVELPETLEEVMDRLRSWSDGLPNDTVPYELANAMAVSKECAICGAPIVDVDGLVEALLDHYGVDEDPNGEIAEALMDSGAEVGDVQGTSLCSYHGWAMNKDD